MAHKSPPSAERLQTFIEGHSLTVTPYLSLLSGAIGGAWDSFNEAIGYRFLPDTNSATLRKFTPPVDGAPLFLDYLCSEPATITYAPAGQTSETLTLNTDYWCEPENALAKHLPITHLEFERRWSGTRGLRGALQITAFWGAAREIPESVYQALLERGAANLWTQLTQSATGGVLGWKDGDRSVDYGDNRWSALNEKWTGKGCNYDRAVAIYRKMSF